VNVYDVPFVRPETVHEVDAGTTNPKRERIIAVAQVNEPGDEVTV
jgi:hypothetical protein